MSFFEKTVFVEGKREISVEWTTLKVPKEVNGDSEKTLLLLTITFFVQIEDMPLN